MSGKFVLHVFERFADDGRNVVEEGQVAGPGAYALVQLVDVLDSLDVHVAELISLRLTGAGGVNEGQRADGEGIARERTVLGKTRRPRCLGLLDISSTTRASRLCARGQAARATRVNAAPPTNAATDAGFAWSLSRFEPPDTTHQWEYSHIDQALCPSAPSLPLGYAAMRFVRSSSAHAILPTPHRDTGDALAGSASRLAGAFTPIIAVNSQAAKTPNGPVYASATIFIVAGLSMLALPIETRGRPSYLAYCLIYLTFVYT